MIACRGPSLLRRMTLDPIQFGVAEFMLTDISVEDISSDRPEDQSDFRVVHYLRES